MKLNHAKEIEDIKSRISALKILTESQSKEDTHAFEAAQAQQEHQNGLEDIVVSKTLEAAHKKANI